MSFATRVLSSTAVAAVAVLVAASFGSPARAQVWNEVGDAGDTQASVQTPVGLYALNQINGSLQFDSDVDLYCLEVLNPAAFSVNLQCMAMMDPSIWLFHWTGQGMVHNDVCAYSYKTIPAGMVAPGTYYVAVTQQGRQAYGASGAMWQTGLFTGPRTPDGPGAANNLSYWSGGGPLPGVTPYTINFTGASYCGTAVEAESHSWGSLKSIYK